MNRASWKFTYTADKLLEAATAKKDFHAGRLDWWAGKRKETEDKLLARAGRSKAFSHMQNRRGPVQEALPRPERQRDILLRTDGGRCGRRLSISHHLQTHRHHSICGIALMRRASHYGIFPPVGCSQYGDLKDWEHKHQDEMRFQQWMRFVCRTYARLKGDRG